ncbi:MAG: family peptidase [Caulobacter sp.]|nr:family peptidase [Caulobacter sp.]
MRSMLLAAVAAASAALAFCAQADTPDPNQWLEDVNGQASMDWVHAENAVTVPRLQGDPRYKGLHDQAFAILSATDRIAQPNFIGDSVYNFWQDGSHVRGVWRRTTVDSYRTANPQWETVLDLDALAASEHANWIFKGANCRAPAYDRCMVQLSNGGKDAVEEREFDLTTKSFVDGGFRLPESKQNVAWLDNDTLLVQRDWGPGTLTRSGYGFVIKSMKRGQALADATEVFRGKAEDVSVSPQVLRDGDGAKVVLFDRGLDFFHSERWMLTPKGPVKLDMPQKGNVRGLLHGSLIITIDEDWPVYGLKAGSLVSVSPEELAPVGPGGSVVISKNTKLIFAPTARQSIDQVTVTANRVTAAIYDNVRGRVITFEDKGQWGWKQTNLPVIDNAEVNLVSSSDLDDRIFYSAEGFVTPTQLKLADTATGASETVKTLPAKFDAANMVVEQFEATSKDGTRIPYFIVHPKGQKLDGSNPTLLHAYGGFQLSKLPVYDPLIGKLWMERGGTYVVANIRGGGEFGPAWHEAALKQNRQRAYDDFFAVAEDLIARKVTSPRRLGIYGRSNGGLLMGVSLTERPDLWNAVVVESPLIDMLRYDKLPAGASWIGEYGDPQKPEEAAYIAKYSPYQNVRAGVKYPEAYITTSTKDDRVHPGHARKLAAKLKGLNVPYLFYENTDGGHANGADPQANAQRWGMHYVYLTQKLMD